MPTRANRGPGISHLRADQKSGLGRGPGFFSLSHMHKPASRSAQSLQSLQSPNPLPLFSPDSPPFHAIFCCGLLLSSGHLEPPPWSRSGSCAQTLLSLLPLSPCIRRRGRARDLSRLPARPRKQQTSERDVRTIRCNFHGVRKGMTDNTRRVAFSTGKRETCIEPSRYLAWCIPSADLLCSVLLSAASHSPDGCLSSEAQRSRR